MSSCLLAFKRIHIMTDDLKRTLDDAFKNDDMELVSKILGWDEEDGDFEEEYDADSALPFKKSRSGSPLTMECPCCGIRGEFKVIRTLKSFYHWNNENVEYFHSIAGSDISYRKRVKRCTVCNNEFYTIEMAIKFLIALMNDIESKSSLISELLGENTKLKEIIQEAKKVLKKVK